MANYAVGDIVVLISGSMRMAVEAVEDDRIQVVWCNEGEIGRDNFPSVLLRKWETHDQDDRRGGPGSGKPYNKGGRDGGRSGGRDDKPRGKPGWDGKPREKKFFRKD